MPKCITTVLDLANWLYESFSCLLYNFISSVCSINVDIIPKCVRDSSSWSGVSPRNIGSSFACYITYFSSSFTLVYISTLFHWFMFTWAVLFVISSRNLIFKYCSYAVHFRNLHSSTLLTWHSRKWLFWKIFSLKSI